MTLDQLYSLLQTFLTWSSLILGVMLATYVAAFATRAYRLNRKEQFFTLG